MKYLTSLLCQLKLNRATGFLLHDRGSLPDLSRDGNMTDPQGCQITAAKLAVDGGVEQR
jgi:hypothetical protein